MASVYDVMEYFGMDDLNDADLKDFWAFWDTLDDFDKFECRYVVGEMFR